jgi:outer membrane protein assembly factor BamA
MMGQPKKEKGIRHWIKNKIGKPPVLSRDVSPENISVLMKNRFFNLGYFNTDITFKKDALKKKFRILYGIIPGSRFRIDSVEYATGNSDLGKQILQAESSSKLSRGEPYMLQNLKSELDRIEYLVKDSGFYYFDSEFLIFRADTSNRDHQVDLRLNFKPNMPQLVYQKAYFNKIYILDDFSVEDYNPDTIEYRGFYYISNRHIFRPDIITDNIHMHPSYAYSRKMHLRTLNQLSDLGVYRFVNAEFEEDSTSNLLNTYIYATPFKKSALTAELNGTIKTTNYVGPGARISWRHRNIFGGAEELFLNIIGNFEVQVGADSINTAYEAGVELGLDIPRPLIFKRLRLNKESVPRTKILGGFNLYRRVELYTMNSFYTTFGYSWRKSVKVSHILNPIDYSFTKVTDQTDAFREYLENNPTVRKSFEEQFIIGSHYAFLYDNLQDLSQKGTAFFRGGIDLSGILTYFLFRSFSGRKPTNDDPYTIFGVPFSNYIMVSPEFRYYLKTGRQSVLATRALFGVGIPMGNSRVLPYVKQFFSGGTNSVRSFVARSIGPGSYLAPVENLGIDQTGDIRLEFNLEYRFHFSKLFMGAAFVDAGNVWLRNADNERPGGEFQLNRFYKEFGIGTGFGFRFDLQVLVFRIDLAWPLYKPYFEEGERWVINDINFFSKDWRKANMIWNFAIGYPF